MAGRELAGEIDGGGMGADRSAHYRGTGHGLVGCCRELRGREVRPAEKLGKPRVGAERIEERMHLEKLHNVRSFFGGTP